jgi:hypothetical protein
MMSYLIQTAMLLLYLTLLVASGCSKGPSFDNTAKLDLMLLGLEMHNVHSSVASELESKSADAKKILQSGNYVLLPGIDMNLPNLERSRFIVAYHKETPTKGGYALRGDGSVELLTAEAFKNAQTWDSKLASPTAESNN